MQILFPEVVDLFSILHGEKGSDLSDQVPGSSGPSPQEDGRFSDVSRTFWPALPQATPGTSTVERFGQMVFRIWARGWLWADMDSSPAQPLCGRSTCPLAGVGVLTGPSA